MKAYVPARYMALLSYIFLLALFGHWCWQFGPANPGARVVLWLFICSGLLLVAPGILRAKRRSHQWLCFILLIYFTWAVQSLLAGNVGESGEQGLRRSHNIVTLVTIIVCFVAAMFTARWSEQGK